jgi:hypothetical protein
MKICMFPCKKVIWVLISVFAGTAILLSSQNSYTETKGLLTDIQAIRKYDRRVKIDITETVQKYIPAGISKDEAVAYLKKNGFKLYPQPLSEGEPEKLAAVKYQDGFFQSLTGFRDKYILVIQFRNNKTLNSWGSVIYQAL